MNIGLAIRSIRKKLGISQFELAEKCDISQTSLSQIESGIKRPSPRTLKKVCESLSVPESVIYIVAMQHDDIPSSKKNIYQVVYPFIRNLTMQMVSSEHINLVEEMA